MPGTREREVDVLADEIAAGTETARTPMEEYEVRAVAYAARRDAEAARLTRAANLTVVCFFGGLALAVGAVVAASWGIAVLAALTFIGAVALFARQGQLQRRVERLTHLTAMNVEGQARLRRDWATLPLREASTIGRDTPDAALAEALAEALAGDLDLRGHASLQHLLSTATLASARTRLLGWMLVPAAPAAIRARQGAARDLAGRVSFREELGLGGRTMGRAQDSYLHFLAWAEDGPFLRRMPRLVWLARLFPALTILGIVVQVATRAPYPFWLPFLLANIILAQVYGKAVGEQLDRVAEQQGAFAPYAELFRVVAAQDFADEETRRLQAALTAGRLRGDVAMLRLDRLVRLSNLRLGMFFPVIQALTLWSFHVLWLLEGWQAQTGPSARGWVEALGEMEALAALGTLAHDEPTWAFPTLEDAPAWGTARLTARDLGHPLLPDDRRIGNDVELGPPGTFLLVTGSNMSGKSTLLRAIGVNVVLAQMGAPVCAAALRLPPVTLATSIRVRDSLEEGVSYFMAELQRLKLVVDVAEAASIKHERVVLYLLDEILHGTNTSERQIAARRILRYLLRAGAIGAVSTHDLTLAQASDLTAAAALVHFTEQFSRGPDGPKMRFDYTLRPGLATSANALKLMELVGLDVGTEDTTTPPA